MVTDNYNNIFKYILKVLLKINFIYSFVWILLCLK